MPDVADEEIQLTILEGALDPSDAEDEELDPDEPEKSRFGARLDRS